MSVDTYSFFLIVLSGFSFVWTFRKVSGSLHGSISDFEYLGFSSIWGVIILAIYSSIMKDHRDQFNMVISNPFAEEAKEALKDLSFSQKRSIILGNVQKVVAVPGKLQVSGYIPVSPYVEYKSIDRYCGTSKRRKIDTF